MKGESITTVSKKHKIALVIAVSGLTIRGLGASIKLAPLIPAPTETAPKAKISNDDSISIVIVRLDEGCATSIPTILQINVAMPDKMHMTMYLHLTKLRAVIGEE